MFNYQQFSNNDNNECDAKKIIEELKTPVDWDTSESEDDEIEEDPLYEQFTVIVDRDKIYLRSLPSKDSDPVTILVRDTELVVDLDKSNDDWYCVCTADGRVGYVMETLVSV